MKGNRLALLPGSFDPVTVGHLDVIRRAARLFDRVTVAVMVNNMQNYVPGVEEKQYLLSLEEREALLREVCAPLENVTVIASRAMLIDLVDELSADVIVKGIRNADDYAYEQHHALWNRQHNPRAETLYLPADPAYDGVSSTLVRQRIAAGEPIDQLVPAPVVAYFRKRAEGRA